MKIYIVTASYRMMYHFSLKHVGILKPIIKDKNNIIKISCEEDLKGRINKHSKVIFLEDWHLLKDSYDIELMLKQRDCDYLYFNSICDNHPYSEGSKALKKYLLTLNT